jgi:hypothetical protein
VNTEGAVPDELVGEQGLAPPKPGEAVAQRPMPAVGRRGRGKQLAAVPPPTLPTEQPKRDVVEILRGDRFEQRNFSKGDGH